MKLIDSIVNPETDLERAIVSHPDFIEGAMWGKPRNGHPEGAVIYHIGEVLTNIDDLVSRPLGQSRKGRVEGDHPMHREKLRLIAIIHDTFKNKVDPTKPKQGENHHAMIARRFAEKFIDDPVTLDIIELHDEAYNAWCKGHRDGKWDKAKARGTDLIHRLGLSLDVYYFFFECDSYTGDKTDDSINWFNKLINETV